jgi:hypothetical protein
MQDAMHATKRSRPPYFTQHTVEAVNCAVEIRGTLKVESANSPPGRRTEFRIGINSGDVMVQGQQVYGDGDAERVHWTEAQVRTRAPSISAKLAYLRPIG